jgi:hypothetical protein
MEYFEVYTEIEIEATPEKVWDTLTDFEKYPEWNPFFVELKGKPEVGCEIFEYMKFSFFPKPILGKSFIIKSEAPKSFGWRGSFIHSFHNFGHGTHTFDIEQISEKKVKLVHKERFRGLLVPYVKSLIEKVAKPHFILMNEALKARCE